MKLFSVVLLLAVALAQLCAGATITVERDGSGDFMVIQDALDAAADGDSILIGPGEYTEWEWVRIPGYSWDTRVFGYVRAHDLTIIGAGQDQTIVGPTEYEGAFDTFDPKCFVYDGMVSHSLTVKEMNIRNCYDGIHAPGGVLYIEDAGFSELATGIIWVNDGSGGIVRNSRFENTITLPVVAKALDFQGSGGSVIVEGCEFVKNHCIVRSLKNVNMIDCVFRNTKIGAELYGDAHVYFRQCRFFDIGIVGIAMAFNGATCEIYDSEVSGGRFALATGQDGRFIAYDSKFYGGDLAVLQATSNPASCEIHRCDFYKGTGPVVVCGHYIGFPAVVHDLSNNYWGTSDESLIQEWIVDGNDDPSINATVVYAPFVGQPVPAETMNWGDVKALFR